MILLIAVTATVGLMTMMLSATNSPPWSRQIHQQDATAGERATYAIAGNEIASCFTSVDDFEPSSWQGAWTLNRTATATFFVPDCPWHAKVKDSDTDEHRLAYRPTDCRLDYVGSSELHAILANRTVVFLGDSVSLGMAQNLMCALWKAMAADGAQAPTLYSRMVPNENGIRETSERSRCVLFTNNTSVCWVSAGKCCSPGFFGGKWACGRPCERRLGASLRALADAAALTAHDVIVVNVGVHYDIDSPTEQQSLAREISSLCFGERVVRERYRTPPTVIFRETGPQHWRSGRYNYWKNIFEPNEGCRDYPVGWTDSEEPLGPRFNPYNHFTNRLLRARCQRLLTLPVWFPSALLGVRDRGGKEGDCTHFYGPGSAYTLWNTMLLRLLRQVPNEPAAHASPADGARWANLRRLLADPAF